MIGACAGDIIGSIYEGRPFKSTEFPLFGSGVRYTDDSVLTIATAAVLLGDFDTSGGAAIGTAGGSIPLNLRSRETYARAYKQYGRYYTGRGYGGNFAGWLRSDTLVAYGSFGNGSAMRVSPVGFAFDTEEEVLAEAEASSAATHDHTEGINGAQAIALAVFLARRDADEKSKSDTKEKIRREIERRFGYDLSRSIDEIRPSYRFNPTCQGSVPESIISFLESDSWEDAVRNAISLGGDADTMADMAGAIAEAYYGGVPKTVRKQVENILDPQIWKIVKKFYRRFELPLDEEERT